MQQVITDFGILHLGGLEIPLRIYGYGLMLVLGFLAAIWLAQWRARRMGESPDNVARCGLLSLVGGIVGSRAAYVIQHWQDQFAGAERPLGAVFNITSGGLIYYGGVILATAMVLVYLAVRHLPIRRYLDIVAPGLMIGLAFGRAGCLLNGCCFGGQGHDHWPLAMRFPMLSRPLLKFDGRENPYSADTEGPSYVYTHQLANARIDPPEQLINPYATGKVLMRGEFRPRKWVHPPRYLHGRLQNDQTVFWCDANALDRAAGPFGALAGDDGVVTAEEWQRRLRDADGLLRGGEHWDEALFFDADGSGSLTFAEVRAYLDSRRKLFDADGDGKLSTAERDKANQILQADQFALAAACRSLPVKPAQVLGIVNALLAAALLIVFSRLRWREGQVFALLAIAYPLTRMVEEVIRDDNPHNLAAGVFTHNQYTSAVLTTIGIILWVALRWLPASAGPTAAERSSRAQPAHGRRRHKQS